MCGIAGIFIHDHEVANSLDFEPSNAITMMADSPAASGPGESEHMELSKQEMLARARKAEGHRQ